MITIMILTLVFHHGFCEEINNKHSIIQIYEQNLNSSLRLDKEDRILINSWITEFQLKRINLTTKYRLQVAKHKEHSFKRSENNAEWIECLNLHKRQIRKSEKDYYNNESECLTTSTMDDGEMIQKVAQVEKEMRKWRKGYRYLVKTCKESDSSNLDAFESCLIQYMEQDNYNNVIQRLILLKLESMGKLFLHLTSSISNLKECLKDQLSDYLEKVRSVMDTLNKCYELKTKNLKT